MDDSGKTKQQLIDELQNLRKKVSELEKQASQVSNNESFKIVKDNDTPEIAKLQELAQNPNFLFQIIDNLPVTLFVKLAKTGEFIIWNKFSEKLFGITQEEAIGKSDYDFFPFEQAEFFRRKDLDTFVDGKVIDIPEEQIESRLYGKLLLHTIKVPLYDEKGNPKYLLGFSEDITERIKSRNELIESEQRNRTIFNNSPLGICYADENGFVVQMNKTYLNTIASDDKKDDVIGKHNLLNLDAFKNAGIQDYFIKLYEGEPFSIETSVHTTFGKDVAFHYIASPVIDNKDNVIGSVLIADDITTRKRAEEALRLSEERYRMLVENAFDAIYLLREWHYEYVNPRFCDITKYSFEELTSPEFDVDCLMTEKSKKFMESRYLSRKNGHEISGTYEIDVRTKTGVIVTVEVNTVSIGDENSIAVLGIMRDITDRKKYENELITIKDFYSNVLESIDSGVVFCDKDDIIRYANRAISEVSELDNDKIIGQNLLQEFIFEDTSYFDTKYRVSRIRQEAVFYESTMIYSESGKESYITGWLIPQYHNNEYNGMICTIQDVTKAKLAEEELMRFASDLQNSKLQLEEKAAQLSVLNKELAEINANKDRFFSIIAHDLRGPFSGFLGLTETLSKDFSDLTLNEMKEMAGAMHTSAERLFKLLDNLLTWSSFQRGAIAFNPESMNMREVIVQNIEIASITARDKDISIINHLKEDSLVHGDRKMLDTVLRNLLTNAIKFTMPGGFIEIHSRIINILENFDKPALGNTLLVNTGDQELNYSEPIGADVSNKEYVEISIMDNGVGITKENIEKLFRIDKHYTTFGTANEIGSGLGLILCKEFIEKNGGLIYITSKENVGSVFAFSLPIG